jgi:hypothetical protein
MKKLFLFFLLSATLLSCKKNDNIDDPNIPIEEQDVNYLFHQVNAYNTIKDAFILSVGAGSNKNISAYNTLNNSLSIIKDSISVVDTMKIIISYGTNIVLCNDNKYRSGEMVLKYNKTKSFSDSTTSFKINILNLRMDSVTINGIITVSNKGILSDTLSWNVTSSIVLATNNLKSLSFNGNHSIKLLNTIIAYLNNLKQVNFNVAHFGIKGQATGTNTLKKTYSELIYLPIEFDYNCRPVTANNFISPFIAGKVSHYINMMFSNDVSYIDFGNRTCDDVMILKRNGYSLTTNFR